MSDFILGLGAQKSGTTWLYRYLRTAPEVNFGLVKEYHTFDRKPPETHLAYDLREGRQVLRTRRGNVPIREASAILGEFVKDHDRYFDYFADLLTDSDVHLTGDITPNYFSMNVERLSMIRETFERRSIRVRPLFVMRNPVYRLESEVKMNLIRKNETLEGPAALERLHERVVSDLRSGRGRYEKTLERMFKVFAPDECFVLFYEEMFRPGIREVLQDQYGVTLGPAPLERQINASAGVRPMITEPEQYDQLRDAYGEVIAGVELLLGRPTNDLWKFKPVRMD